MNKIEIFGYALINGETHYPKLFKHCFVNTVEEVAAWEEKVKKRYEKKYKSECTVYAVYKQKIRV